LNFTIIIVLPCIRGLKMIEHEEFFQRFEKGFTFKQWIENMDEKFSQRTQRYYDKLYMMIVGEFKHKFADLVFGVHIAAIVEDNCWDCQFYIPVLMRLAEDNPKIKIKLFQKHEHLDWIETTNGGIKSPYVMFYSEDGFFVDKWVERPTKVYELYANLRLDHGFDENEREFYKQYRKAFLKDQESFYIAAADELTQKICRVHAIQATSKRINKKRIQEKLIAKEERSSVISAVNS